MNWIKSLVGFLFLIAFVIGAMFQLLFPQHGWVTLSLWGAAGVFLVIWVILNRSSVLAFFGRKSVHYGANVGLIIFLVLGILTALNVLGKQYFWKKDLTRTGVNTLSEQTLKILHGLDKNVELVFFTDPREKEKVEKTLRLYHDESKKFRYRIVDPNREPVLTRSLGIKRNNSGVFTIDGSEKKISVEEYTEEKLTNALVKLLKTKEQTIYFTEGHSERMVADPADRPDSITQLKRDLEDEGYKVKALNLTTENAIPADAAAIAIVGPRSQFFPRELNLLKAWIAQGGRALIALELDINRGTLADGSVQMTALLKDYGLGADTHIVVDPHSREPQVALGLVANAASPIVKDFPTSNMGLVANFLFPITTRLIPDGAVKDIKRVELVKTSPDAWAENDWKSVKSGRVDYTAGKDFRGSLDLAVSLEREGGPKTRIVAFPSSSFLSNGLVRLAKNRDLFLNSIGWLTDQEEFISIHPKADADSDSIDLSKQWLNVVFFVVVLLVPAVIFSTGLWIWFRRRGR